MICLSREVIILTIKKIFITFDSRVAVNDAHDVLLLTLHIL
jgi:hypothetical protein